jgi:hypothetical protein
VVPLTLGKTLDVCVPYRLSSDFVLKAESAGLMTRRLAIG